MNLSPLKAWQTWTLLALANLFWAGNWVVGRALRELYPPVALNFWRWLLAALILAPFALPLLRGQGALLRMHAGLLVALSATGAALFQAMVYVGLSGTTSVNAVLLSSACPLFVMLCAWVMAREKATAAQLAGMAISLAGIAIILGRGDASHLLRLDVHAGDAWILAALPVFGLYSVLLRRLPKQLQGTRFLFLFSAIAVPLLAGPMMMQPPVAAAATTPAALAGLGYVALFASVLAFACWNRAVAAVGPNAAGSSLPLMPLFGTVLAMVFLGEPLHAFHVAGLAAILAGIAVATRRRVDPAAINPPAAVAGARHPAPAGRAVRTIPTA